MASQRLSHKGGSKDALARFASTFTERGLSFALIARSLHLNWLNLALTLFLFCRANVPKPCGKTHGYWARTPQTTPSAHSEQINLLLAPRSGGFPASAPNSRVLQDMVRELFLQRHHPLLLLSILHIKDADPSFISISLRRLPAASRTVAEPNGHGPNIVSGIGRRQHLNTQGVVEVPVQASAEHDRKGRQETDPEECAVISVHLRFLWSIPQRETFHTRVGAGG